MVTSSIIPPTTVQASSTVPTASPAVSQSNHVAAIIISVIAAFIVIGFIVAFVSFHHHKWKRCSENTDVNL